MKYKIVRYIRTSTLSRVLDCFDDSQICRLNAKRSSSIEKNMIRNGLDYVNVSLHGTMIFELKFNSLIHGKFNKEKVLEILQSSELIKDATIQTFDVEVSGNKDFYNLIARELDNPTYAKMRYIAHFEEYPLRRENEKRNAFIDDIKNFRTVDETKQGFEPASLDLQYILPIREWKETVLKNKLSREYQDRIDAWRRFTEDNSERGGVIRKAMEGLFKNRREMWETRQYRMKRENQWSLCSIGEPQNLQEAKL